MPLQCPNCNTIHSDSAKFCNQCGQSLIENLNQNTGSETSVKTETFSGQQEKTTANTSDSYNDSNTISTVQIPPVSISRKQPSKHIWRNLRWFVFISGLLSLLIIVSNNPLREGIEGFWEAILMFLFGALPMLFIGIIFVLIRNKFTFIGIVDHMYLDSESVSKSDNTLLKREGTQSSNVRFMTVHFKRTNKNFIPLKDRNGFLLPVLVISVKPDIVLGDPLQIGQRIVVMGKIKKKKPIALKVWNLDSEASQANSQQISTYFGLTIDKAQPRQIPDPRNPEQRKINIWEFRIQLTSNNFQEMIRDGQGNLSKPVPIVIRAFTIEGPLKDGDRLEVTGVMLRGILNAKRVINHSSANKAEILIKEWAGLSV